jgi:hypothetical protein
VYIWHNSAIQSNDDCISETFAKVSPWLSTVDNPNVAPEDDCALRAFTIEMAAYIAPASSKMNWTTLSQSAFQMNHCNGTLHTGYRDGIRNEKRNLSTYSICT